MEGGDPIVDIEPYHRRLIEAALGVCEEYGLALAGGYAMKAHGLVDRPSKDVDFATANPLPIEEIAHPVAEAYRAQGFVVVIGHGNETYVRLNVTAPESGESCEVDLMKVTLELRPTKIGRCPVVGFEDAIGLKMGALAGRGVARDLIDVASMAGDYGFERLEWLGRSHAHDFSLHRLVARLEFYELMYSESFKEYGLDDEEILRVKRFACEWAQDINLRLLEETPYEDPLDDEEIDRL